MNKVILTGRIAKELVLRETKTGIKVCDFTIATNRPMDNKKADFVDCMVWDKQAENLVKFQEKGSLVAVFGELRVDSYEVEGKKKYKTFVLVNNIEFLGKKEETQQVLDKDKPFVEFGQQFKEQEEIDMESEYPF